MLTEPVDLDLHPVARQRGVIDQVPLIDVGDLVRDSSAPAAKAAIDQIASACKTWGFFQITNHGISRAQVDEVWRETHGLFQRPLAQKLEIERSKENPWGFYNRELTKNQRDKKEVFDFTRPGIDPIYAQQNRWPADDEFRRTMEQYLADCTELSLKLLEGFCLGLGLPPEFLHPHFVGNHTGFVRLNYYPVEDTGMNAGEADEAELGIHHHADAGVLTVLLQDEVSGLQVHRDGYWYDIPTIEDAMVINTGDMMQVWSNDIYQAAIHRVLAMDTAERYSIPFFFNPAADCEVSPLPSVVDAAHPARYRGIKWSDFRGRRTDGDYADYGSEVQISQFRI